ncbi:MAG: ABC transporter substrate-binding protein [Thermomicrobiales bacterium]
MPDNDNMSRSRDMQHSERTQLLQTLRAGAPAVSRRDLIRWSAISAAATGVTLSAGRGASAAAVLVQDEDVETDVQLQIPFVPYGQPVVLDPHRAPNWGPFWLLYPNVWGGLLRYTELGGVVEDLAETYTVSDDGLVYTFKIRPDVTYANGTQVVADHFIQSWKRALDPQSTSPMAEFMSPVEGFEAFVAGESEEIGFQTLDETTVAITLSEPYTYFTSYLAAFVWDVIDPAGFEGGSSGLYQADAGTGPWRVTEFTPDAQIVMEPNPNYYGGTSRSLTQLTWTILTGADADQAALDLYRDEDAISADVPISLLETVRGDEQLADDLRTIDIPGSTRSLAMDFTKPPFDDVRVRRAFAQAIDRDVWANEIYLGTFQPTSSFIPPVVEELSGYEAVDGLAFDPEAARTLLEEAGFANGEGLPELVLYQDSADTDAEKERVAALLAMLEENLGVTIRHDTDLTAVQINTARQDEGGLQLDLPWWWNVTETPHLLNYVFTSDSPYMEGYYNWSEDLEPVSDEYNPAEDARMFNELVAQAAVEQDEAARNDLYRQAETLVLENAVYAPLGNWIQMYVQKPWLQGTKQGPWTGRLPILFDADVVVVGRAS